MSEATDVWGLGATLYEAGTTRVPFSGRAARGHRYPQLVQGADPVRTHRRLPAPLGAAIDACLRQDPSERPTIAARVQTLNQWAPEPSVAPTRTPRRASGPPKRRLEAEPAGS